MKIVVHQSYRTSGVPRWIGQCMQSVREWSAACGFDYRIAGDEFFDRCPPWYREKVGNDRLPLSDLARLEMARDLLAQGYDRAIWIDADVLVFEPRSFRIDPGTSYALCYELWVNREGHEFVGWERVNNAVCVFDRGNPFLDFYLDSCRTIVRQSTQLDRRMLGPYFLTRLRKLVPFELITSVGTFNPILIEHLSRGDDRPLRAYRARFGAPIHAANLCSSFCDVLCQGIVLRNETFEAAVQSLLNAGASEA